MDKKIQFAKFPANPKIKNVKYSNGVLRSLRLSAFTFGKGSVISSINGARFKKQRKRRFF